MAFFWNIPAAAEYQVGVGATNAPQEWLAAINTHFVANSGAVGAVWEVANYQSTTPRYVLLRRKSLAVGRIIIFGEQGSTPHAAAVRGTATASVLYIGYSKSSVSNTEDASWIAGAPLTASDYIPAVQCWPMTVSLVGASPARFTYAEAACGVHLLADNITNGWATAGAGELVAGTQSVGAGCIAVDISCTYGQGGSWVSGADWPQIITANGTGWQQNVMGTDSGYTVAQSGLVCKLGNLNLLCFRATALGAGLTLQLLDPATLKVWWMPIPICCSTTYLTYGVFGKFKQMAFGPRTTRGVSWYNGATGARVGYAHGRSITTLETPMWFLDVDI